MIRFALLLISLGTLTTASATETVRWERLPLAVSLQVGRERVIFLDRDMRVGVPASLSSSLRIQSTGGAIYLFAESPFEPERVQLQDINGGALILLDVSAQVPAQDAPAFAPLRILDTTMALPAAETPSIGHAPRASATSTKPSLPLPIMLTRYAAQSLYAPLRTIEPLDGVTQVPVGLERLEMLLPTLPINAHPLAAWRLDEHWVTALRLTNTGRRPIFLDPRLLFGDFVSATFQHSSVGPAGDATDTTVLYLVTRGVGLADALLPKLSAFDSAKTLTQRSAEERNDAK